MPIDAWNGRGVVVSYGCDQYLGTGWFVTDALFWLMMMVIET